MVNVFLGLLLTLAMTGPPTTQETPSPAPSPSPSPPPPAASVEDLYRSILPAPIGEAETVAVAEIAGQAPGTSTAANEDRTRSGETQEGLHLGRARINPSLHMVYVNAEGALFDTPEPVADSYFEMRPQVTAELPVSTGFVRGGYRAHIRRGSSFDLVDSTTAHFADLALEIPLSAYAEITGSEHYAHGVLETAEVDPGREYFFGLGRFTRHVHSAGLRLLPDGRVDATAGASIDTVRVDERSAFVDHEQQTAFVQAGYEVRPDLRAGIGYSYLRVPATTERPELESVLHSLSGELRGELLPLTTGALSIGYSSQRSPNAGPGGTRFTGLTASGRLEKSFTPSSSVILSGARATHVSAFEQNAFYVSGSVEALVRAAMPWSVAAEAGVGFHRNDYRTVASSIGVPRHDSIRGWTLGLARPLTRHAFVRADYRRDRRDSNVDVFDSHSHVLMLQLGIGVFAAGALPR